VPALDVLVSVDMSRRQAALSVVQKLETEPVTVRLDWRGLTPRNVRGRRLQCDDLLTENTLTAPDRVVPVDIPERIGTTVVLPPATFSVYVFEF
jgi:alpha-L-arabinofuranosidase